MPKKVINVPEEVVPEPIATPVTTDAAKQALLADQEVRRTECGKELEAVCKKYNCNLDASIILRNSSVVAQISVVAL